jgi:hypothetical protein
LCAYKVPPKILPGFPEARPHKPKTPMNVKGAKKRKRWKAPDGTIYEWDYQHGTVEKYDKRGRHQGEFHKNGGKRSGPDPNKRIDP